MSNLLGDFLVGSTMVGADPEETKVFSARKFRIFAAASLASSFLYLSPRLTEAIEAKATVVGNLQVRVGFSAIIQGSSDLSDSVFSGGLQVSVAIQGQADLSHSILNVPVPLQLTGVIQGSSSASLTFMASESTSLGGDVGVTKPVTVTYHGQVLTDPGIKPNQGAAEDRITQPRPYFV